MSMNDREIADVVAAMAPVAVGGWIQRVYQTDESTVAFDIRTQGRSVWLVVSCRPQVSRLLFLDEKPAAPPAPPRFGQTLRKYIQGGIAMSLDVVPDDRIVRMSVRYREAETTFVAELFGRNGNLYLLDHDGKILDLARVRSGPRPFAPGDAYEPPPPPPKRDTSPTARDFGATDKDDLPWAVGRFYAAQVAEMEVKGLRERLDRALSRESKRVTKYRDKLEREFRELPDPDGTQNLGDHLAANLHLVRQGASEVTVADLYGGEPVTVPLDPALSPSKNLDRFYRRARRDRRKIEGLRRRIDEMTEREWWLDERREALAAAGDDTEALRALESKLTDDGLLTAPKPKQVISGKKKAAQVPSGPRRFTAKDGSEILVGRTSTENDELTFRIGRGNDLWLHAAGAAGSHVVVRSAKGREVDHETLLDAATLAVHYSKVSRQESGEVKYTPCKNVRKPKGAPPGKVIASPAKTIFVRVEPDRLARLQASRASSGINDG